MQEYFRTFEYNQIAVMEEFNRWLRKPAHGLGGRIPEQLLNYISGIELVSRELTRIEYGDFS
jgi:uncharacterized protein (DUF2384 family)